MERRYHIESKNHKWFIEAKERWVLEDFRKVWREFKGMKIKDIIQAYPSEIPLNKVIYRD